MNFMCSSCDLRYMFKFTQGQQRKQVKDKDVSRSILLLMAFACVDTYSQSNFLHVN